MTTGPKPPAEALAVRLPRRAASAALIEHEQRWLPRLSPRLPLPQGEADTRASRHVQHMINTEGDGHERVLRKGRHRFLGHIDCHWSVQLDNNSAVNERQHTSPQE